MKKIILFFLVLSSIEIAYAQTKYEDISKTTIGIMSCGYTRSINLSTKDTATFVSIAFQNPDYTTITDIHEIVFSTTTDRSVVIKFDANLHAADTLLGTKTNMSWNENEYKMNVFDSLDQLYLGESASEGDVGIWIPKEQIEQLIAWLELNGFKSNK